VDIPRPIVLRLLRDAVAIVATGLFLFPILWTALDSIKPGSALYDKNGITFFDFVPTLENYKTIFGGGSFDSSSALRDTAVVALGATLLGLMVALPTAFALWRFGRGRDGTRLSSHFVLAMWMLPPIALIFPLFMMYHAAGLFDTYVGLILVEAALHLPFAILVLKSFFDEVPLEVAEAAQLDGANEWHVFARITAPMIAPGIAATAILFLIFCWTEFFLSLFLTSFLRLVPVQIANMSNALGGSTFALSTTALLPCALFILFVQKHLARGFSLGSINTPQR
jgi:multiple sugar transport system permease protein